MEINEVLRTITERTPVGRSTAMAVLRFVCPLITDADDEDADMAVRFIRNATVNAVEDSVRFALIEERLLRVEHSQIEQKVKK